MTIARPLRWSVAIAWLAAFCGCGAAQKLMGDAVTLLPQSGDAEGLVLQRQPSFHRGDKAVADYLGGQARLYKAYGANTIGVGEYAWGAPGRRLTVEAVKCDNRVAASGLFHRHRGQIAERGAPLRLGAEGVVDAGRGGRNLYFYQGQVFFKFIYTGPEPVPDLASLARRCAERVGGDSHRPEGYELLAVDGVDQASIGVTPGYTLNFDFLPPSVCALAPGAGSPHAAAFVVAAVDRKAAESMERDHRDYLRRHQGSDYGESLTDGGSRLVWWGVDPGPPPEPGKPPARSMEVIATRVKNILIFITHAPTRREGGILLDRIAARAP